MVKPGGMQPAINVTEGLVGQESESVVRETPSEIMKVAAWQAMG